MRRFAVFVLMGFVVAAWNGRAAADQKEAEAALKAKGLTRRMTCFCLAEEAELAKLLQGRQSEAGKRKKAFDDAQAKATAAKAEADDLETKAQQLRQEYDAIRVQLQAAPQNSPVQFRLAERNNLLVSLLDAVPARMQQAEKSLKETRAAAATQRESFIDYVMQLRKKYDALLARYKQLADDAEVSKALEQFNAGTPRTCTLGPLKTTTDALKKLEGGVLSDSIPIHEVHGGNWMTYVTINNKPPLEFMIDTGASLISLPYKMAAALGLSPTSESPEITCTLADGRPIKCRLVTADTVRLGRFEVKGVKCAVLPEECPEATPLLGMSYLGNFTFKIDKGQGVLAMSGIDESGKPGRGAVAHAGRGEKKSDAKAGGKPASASAATAEPAPPSGTPAQQLAALLALNGQGDSASQGDLIMQGPGGKLVFHPSKRGPAKSLQARFGDPDEMHKMSAPHLSGDTPQDAPAWKLWSWGTVKVLVDDSGTTRYYCVGKE